MTCAALPFTPGPWRWELNRKHRGIKLAGGVPRFDLTVVDFVRWGMSSAVPRFREPDRDRLDIMHRAHERADWSAPFEGREHHADWCANVTHPDAQLIAAAPTLFAALRDVVEDLDECMDQGLASGIDLACLAAARRALHAARGGAR